MNLSTQLHLEDPIPAAWIKAVNAGIMGWYARSHSKPDSLSIVVTDNSDFASDASETNDLVILLSDQPETVLARVIVMPTKASDIEWMVERELNGRFP